MYVKHLGGVDRRLAAFTKVKLTAGDSTVVEIQVGRDQLRWWNPDTSGWAVASGPIELEIRGTFGVHAVTSTGSPPRFPSRRAVVVSHGSAHGRRGERAADRRPHTMGCSSRRVVCSDLHHTCGPNVSRPARCSSHQRRCGRLQSAR